MRLQDKIALITGGGSGIGRAMALRFASEGAMPIAVDRHLNHAQETIDLVQKAGGNGLALEADVSNRDMVNAAIGEALTQYEKIDILVNNAAISSGDDILTIEEDVWDLDLAVDLKGVYLCAKAVLPKMIEQQAGAILNIASVNGLTGLGEEAYSAAKAGVINLTKNMAIKYGQHNVRVNVICPGTIQTPIWKERYEVNPKVFDQLAPWYPLGRVGQPEDIANAALFLVSDEAAWITGTVLNVDGGLMAGSYRMAQGLQDS